MKKNIYTIIVFLSMSFTCMLKIENQSDKKLSDIYSKLILPPAYRERYRIIEIQDLPPKSERNLNIKLPEQIADKKYSGGKQYFALMSDFNYGTIPGRIWSDVKR